MSNETQEQDGSKEAGDEEVLGLEDGETADGEKDGEEEREDESEIKEDDSAEGAGNTGSAN